MTDENLIGQQVKSLMELQQNTAYRNAYNSAWPGAGDLPGGPRMGYPFPPMPGHNSYPTYNHLGYPGAGSPGRDGKTEGFDRCDFEASDQVESESFSPRKT